MVSHRIAANATTCTVVDTSSWSLFASISAANTLMGREVTESAMNFSKLVYILFSLLRKCNLYLSRKVYALDFAIGNGFNPQHHIPFLLESH